MGQNLLYVWKKCLLKTVWTKPFQRWQGWAWHSFVVFHELRHYVTDNDWIIVSSISFLFHVSNSPLDTLIPVLTMLQWISILINFSRTLAIFCRQGAADYVREEWVMFFKLLHITLSFFWWSEVVYLSLLLCIVTMQLELSGRAPTALLVYAQLHCWSRLNCTAGLGSTALLV